ncbi:DUF1003 domain-containing protein [Pontibacter anaerobius]|uniref:DUF1003 domain-containing protein n=1 Tax=Pontibacter anaerobius TaxID=2993940 RepID=A0ABT3RCM1_9BACT|nr:DUF1003 domain-containing protein [Pontibacter anaerobius]MCX2739275.1 DUF1003 domain-containing protein [Pontibacter anaerobius]
MRHHREPTGLCQITKKHLPNHLLVPGKAIRPNVLKLIKKDYPEFDEDKFVALDVLAKYRKLYLEQLLRKELGELTELEEDVVKSINRQELLSSNVEEELEEQISLGDRMADHIASFGGSWTFISIFFSFLLVWMAINVYVLATKPFDPYPFILLNLILSCLAAIQAPIIMMSQNRQEAKDRSRSEHDYKVNLKAELEIRLLHEKIDHLLMHQNQQMVEIQQMQLDLLEDIMEQLKKNHHSR